MTDVLNCSNMEIEPQELLEEMLRRGEQTLHPTLRKCTERFVDIFNHNTTQTKMSDQLRSIEGYFQKLKDLISQCKSASTLFHKMKCLKELLQSIQNKLTDSDLASFLSRLFNTGFVGLVTEENLDFLTSDDLDIAERVKKFLHYLEHGGQKKENLEEAFKEYIVAWKINKRKDLNDDEFIRFEREMRAEFEREMRAEFEKALCENKQFLYRDQLINEIKEKFKPLRDRLVAARDVYGIALTAASGIFQGVNYFRKETLGNNVIRASKPGWFDDTSRFIAEYLDARKTEGDLLEFIEREQLEPDLHHFQENLDPWLDELRSKITQFETINKKSYLIPKELILKEVDRTWKFLYAVILNKPELIQRHQEFLDDMILEAANLTSSEQNKSLLPAISFGQLPMPDGKKQRVVTFKFVLSSSLSEQAIREIMQKLQNLFQNVEDSSRKLENGVNIIEMRMKIDDNAMATVSRFISNLADLQVRGVLIGDFGLGGFRHAMNPAFNRIYSLNQVDKAEGFISTYYSGSLDRGGEPYYCPNGWRRYSIDVGLTGPQFEAQYKNWHVAYHGTEGHVAMAILLNGIRASDHGWFNEGGGVVYLSPSIEYSGHHRYARVWKVKNKYVQMVLQVRVNRNIVFEKKHGTVLGAFPTDPPIDCNFRDNRQLEWVIKWPPGIMMTALNGILVYGIMLRVSDKDPKELPQNAWWAS